VNGDILMARYFQLDSGGVDKIRTVLLRSLNEVTAPFRQVEQPECHQCRGTMNAGGDQQ